MALVRQIRRARGSLAEDAGIIGRSSAMQALLRRVERVGPLDVPVLIQGESGTGKELLATAIHRLSRRRAKRFEVVNCGTLTRELLLSELFGHERGAFTGAVERRPGLLSVADGGTVFLDEVGELLPEAQVMLLRFLANGEIRPVGSTRTVRVDVRVIAATHRDLEGAMRQGSFREDLYYRLRRVVLEIPPLRTRREDIPLLTEHCRLRFNERYGLAVDGVTEAAMRRLEAYPWPGNVRELEAVVEQAMIFQSNGWVRATDLSLPRSWPTGAPDDVKKRVGAGPGVRLSRSQEEALRIASAQRDVRRQDLTERYGVSHGTARLELRALVRLGLLRRMGRGRATRYVPRLDPSCPAS